MVFRWLLTVLSLAVAVAPAVQEEDLTITYRITGRGAAPISAKQYYSASKIRTSDSVRDTVLTPAGERIITIGGRDTVLDLAGERIITIDNKRKEYSEITLDEFQAAMRQMAAQRKQVMKNAVDVEPGLIPPAMREEHEQMRTRAISITVTKGGTRTIAGYACQEYTIAMGIGVKNGTCNTTSLKAPFDPAQFRKLWAFSTPTLASFMEAGAEIADQLQQVQGLPLWETSAVSIMGRDVTTTKEATELKKGAIPASAFEVPAGYKKIESPIKLRVLRLPP